MYRFHSSLKQEIANCPLALRKRTVEKDHDNAVPVKNSGSLKMLGFVMLAVLFVLSSQAKAAWTLGEWYEGSNGYLYSVQLITGESYNWIVARSQAQALTVFGLGVDLAPAASFEENNFIFYGVNDAQYWNGPSLGPYLGGYDTSILGEPFGTWVWVSGEAFSFAAWVPGQPDNAGGIEHALQYYLPNGLDGTQDLLMPKTWNDIDPLGNLSSYYVARTVSAVPEPGVAALLAGAGVFMLLFAKRRFL